MNRRLSYRLLSLALALAATFGVLGSIDHLASAGPEAAQWAARGAGPRA